MTTSLFNSPKVRLRAVGIAEGLSYLVLLFIGVPLKRLGGHPEVVQIVGPIHGLLFVLYVLTVIQAKTEYGWPLGKTLLSLLASIIPGGTFYADHKIFRYLPDETTHS
jgi:integral membrane protein